MDRPPSEFRSPLPPPRFSLATMFWGVSMLAVFFAAFTYLGGYATLLIALFAAAILAHVAGNALGTRLRDGDRKPLAQLKPGASRHAKVDAEGFAPATRLRNRHALGRSAIIATLAGATAGGLLGGVGLTLLMNKITVQAVTMAVVASAVLGGIWAFAAASFIQVSFTAAREATSEEATGEERSG